MVWMLHMKPYVSYDNLCSGMFQNKCRQKAFLPQIYKQTRAPWQLLWSGTELLSEPWCRAWKGVKRKYSAGCHSALGTRGTQSSRQKGWKWIWENTQRLASTVNNIPFSRTSQHFTKEPEISIMINNIVESLHFLWNWFFSTGVATLSIIILTNAINFHFPSNGTLPYKLFS